ncbi:MAG: nucleotidyltransferase domain-containing protein [Patescibacteria group bacterium]
MWQIWARRRVERELPKLLDFLLGYFGDEVCTVVVFGSYLRWSFRKDSDVDVAVILRDSPKWQWSNSRSRWEWRETPPRQEFYRALGVFLVESRASRAYDVKIFTARDLELLEEFQTHVLTRGMVVPSIRSGRIIFRQTMETTMVEMKKGHKSFLEFLDTELKSLGMMHWYTSGDAYGLTCDGHDIGRVVVTEYSFLGIVWTKKRRITVANIIAEPDSPIHKGAKDAFRLRVKDREVLPVLQQLAEKFDGATFGLKSEIIY